jgi:hypothetical protein
VLREHPAASSQGSQRVKRSDEQHDNTLAVAFLISAIVLIASRRRESINYG